MLQEEIQAAMDDGYLLLKRSGARFPIDNLEFIGPIMNLDENIERIFLQVFGYIPSYYSEGVSKMIESNKKITCHVYYVDNNKNCNEFVNL